MRPLLFTLLLLSATPTLAAPLLVVDAVPDASAPWLADAPVRYAAWLEQHQVDVFLQLVAPVFATRLDASRPLRVHLVALRAGDHLRARTLADDLAVQIRAEDTPDRRADVIVHEAVHALQQRSHITAQLPQLPDPAHALLDEALATAIGQGLWRWLDHALGEALGEMAWRQGRDRYDEERARPWYVAEKKGVQIDAWARALEPFMARAIAYGTPIDRAADALLLTWRQAVPDPPTQGQ
jgi:hypothetical protein